MKPTKQIRIRALALLLALAAVVPLAVLPAHAARFQDVADQGVSVAADTLCALGVVSGTGEGEFSPEGHLTRAQLCKMAVEIMGMGEQAEAQAYRTIFTDMKNHWARGYVNLAAITEVPAESGTRLMLGLGNGRFGPDREVTYQEAATLALRILGYGEEANRAWPYSAIETAAELGLDQDLGVENPAGPITRGQTALLFYHLLSAPVKTDGKPYASTLGDTVENAILLASDATVNGQSGWVTVAEEGGAKSYLAAGPVDQSLLGKRGWAVMDKQGHFVTLLPDDSSSVTAAVQRKQAYYLYLNNQRYTLSESTPVYTGSTKDGGITTYKEYMANLRTGTVVTLYLDQQGKVVGLFRAEASNETRFLVVGTKGISTETFRPLTGDERNYTIRKNGASIALSAIKPYDVATYDPMTKVLDVCDVRLSCIYENASPSPTSPSHIFAAGGNEFDVLADAIDDFSKQKIGEPITLLFTSSGKVAGLLPKDARNVTCDALGVLVGDEFQLLGCSLSLKAGAQELGEASGNIFNASSSERGKLALEPAGTKISTPFNTVDLTLGTMRVSPGAMVYEQTLDGLIPRDLSELPSSVGASQYHKNSSGLIDLVIVSGYSGDNRVYGRIDVVTGYKLNRVLTGWQLQVLQQELLLTTKDGSKPYPIGAGYHASGYGTVLEHNGSFAGVTYLQEIKNVRSSDFYTQNGVTYVRTSKGVYPVDENVQCFNEAASVSQPSASMPLWVDVMLRNNGFLAGDTPPGGVDGETTWSPGTGDIKAAMFGTLGECRSFSDTVTVYIDTRGQMVRVVTAGG